MDGPLNWLELDSSAARHNLQGVRRLVGRTDITAVVKVNAYGAGAAGMARVLAESGVTSFAVATVREARELREHGVEGEIVCLAYVTDDELDAVVANAVTPAIFDAETAHWLADRLHSGGLSLPVWVKVDTGLGRLGVPVGDAPAFLRELATLEALRLEVVYSTLTENPERNAGQVRQLIELRDKADLASSIRMSIASSQGILSLPEAYLDIVRPGIVLCGFEPSDRERMSPALVERADLRCVATWKTKVEQMRSIRSGQQIGYGAKLPLERDARVAVLGIGWADGYPAGAAGKCHVLIGGRRWMVLEVSANSTIVDVSGCTDASRGDEAVLLGTQAESTIEPGELASVTGSVYRILAAIPSHVPRLWD